MTVFCCDRQVDICIDFHRKSTAAFDAAVDSRVYKTDESIDLSHPLQIQRRERLILSKKERPDDIEGLFVIPSDHPFVILQFYLKTLGFPAKTIRVLKKSFEKIVQDTPGKMFINTPDAVSNFHLLRDGSTVAVFAPCCAFGDSLAFLSAMAELKSYALECGKRIRIVILSSFCSAVTSVYRRCNVIDEVLQLPAPVSSMASVDMFISVDAWSSVNVSEPSRSLVESMLLGIGRSPAEVPASRKRIPKLRVIDPGARAYSVLKEARERYQYLIFFAPQASTIRRSMPMNIIDRTLSALMKYKEIGIINSLGFLEGNNVINIAAEIPTFLDFVSVLAACDGCLSVDTSAYYVADSLNIPATALFTTNDALMWTAQFPTVRGVQVGDPANFSEEAQGSMSHLSVGAEEQWRSLDITGIVDELRSRMPLKERKM